MLTTSKEYKQALQENIRQFTSQVEIFLDENANYPVKTETEFNNLNVSVTGDFLDAEEVKRIFDYNNFSYKYASLEENYTQLDGTFILPNKNFSNRYRGYVGEIGSSSVDIINIHHTLYEYALRLSNVFTIYFEEGYATSFQIRCIPLIQNNMTHEYSQLDEITYTFTNDYKSITIEIPVEIPSGWSFAFLKEVEIIIDEWSEPNRRARIRHINNGKTILFDDDEVVDIKLIEQTDIYNENLPSNELNITLNNYDKKFNMLDYSNLYNSMDKDTYIVASIGMNTSNGYEYLSLGRYAFDYYENNKDMLTNLKCIGAVENLLETNEQFLTSSSKYLSEIPHYINISKNNFPSDSVNIQSSNYDTYREQAQAIGILGKSFLKQLKDIPSCITNYNILTPYGINDYSLAYEFINKDNIVVIRDNMQLSFPEIKKRSQIRMIKFNYIRTLNEKNEYTTIFEDTVYNTEYNPITGRYESQINIKSSTPHTINKSHIRGTFDGVVTYFNNVRDIELNEYEIRFTNGKSTFGPEQVKIELIECDNSGQNNIVINENIKSGSNIEYNCNFLNNVSKQKEIAQYIFSIDKEYEFSLEILGDLSLEVGDVIYFSTPYYKNMFGIIQSIDTTFNGGLTQIIKGVCSNDI